MTRVAPACSFVLLLTAACAQQTPPTSSAPLPALSAVADETQTPTADPKPEQGASQALTMDECRSQPGEVLTDKGDGKLHSEGCPDGRKKLGVVRVGVENGLCCAPASGTPAAGDAPGPASPPPSAKRPPCTSDQTCNADESVSALWGKCTPLGVCECKPGFELNPLGRCQKVVR